MFLSVHNTSWHNFNEGGGGDDGGTETCPTCNGTWEFDDVVADPVEFPESVDRTYRARNGDQPTQCPGTSREHGEAPCQAGDGNGCDASQDGPCEHTEHDCNCAYCTG